jgi:uncharacterized membrane protein YgcG
MKSKNLLFLICWLFLASASFAQKERIINFEVQLVVNQDRSVSVTELISVYANGNKIKRGITRNFPSGRSMNGRSINMKYQIEEVQKDGKPEPYFTESSGFGYKIFVGQKEVSLPPGYYTYMIKYRVPNQVGFFENYDEIYWNAIGTDVEFEIEKATCKVTLPTGASVIQETAYTGYLGQTSKEYTVNEDGRRLDYQVNRKLNPREGLTVAVGFPKGIVSQPSFLESYGTLMVIILGLIFLLPYYFYTWWTYGQDPPMPASYPIWNAPDELSASSINYILKEGYQRKSFTASIIDLAIKGFLKIEEKNEDNFFLKSTTFELIKIKDADDSLPEEERKLLIRIFSGKKIVSIDGVYDTYIESAYNSHQASLSDQHRSFIRKGNNLKFIWIPLLISFLIGGLSFFLFAINPYADGLNIKAMVIFVPIAIIGLLLYYFLIKKPTVEKLELQSRIKGFKMYLEMAEKDRLNLLNPPKFTPEHFEQVLPFAFALGVEHQWSEKFKNILEAAQYRPQWNNSSSPVYFSDHFSQGFSSNLVGSATKPAQSGGGSGGGGFSGGGGGGGGVGGW